MYSSSSEYIFLTNPGGYSQVHVNIGKGKPKPVEHHISSQGLRDRVYGPKEPDEYRVLMLGDSFTQGHAVAAEDTIPKQLERILKESPLKRRVSVINAGLCAAGPLQELGMLRKHGLKLEPDLVILQLFPSNDVENSLSKVRKHLRAYDTTMKNFLQLIQQRHAVPCRAELWARKNCYVYRALTAMCSNRNLVAENFLRLRVVPRVQLERFGPRAQREFGIEVDLCEWYPELDEGMEIMKRDILSILDTCTDHGLPIYAYCIPAAPDLYDDLWDNARNRADNPVIYCRNKALKLTQAFLDEQKTPSFSVFDMLAQHIDGPPLYYIYDGHLTEYGNYLVAQQIAAFLLAHGTEIGLMHSVP